MLSRHNFAPRLYYQLTPDGLVPKDHLLRRIASAIDFSLVYPMARAYYSHTGQPSVDPVVLLKVLLIGYLSGITSERRLPGASACPDSGPPPPASASCSPLPGP